MSGLYGVLSWLVYAVAAVLMLAAVVSAILAGLALRFVAEALRGFGADPEETESWHTEESRAN